MKTSSVIMAVGLAVAAAAQSPSFPSGFPACGQTCIENMLNKGASFNCTNGDLNCLCPKQDFGYGIRDCSDEACPNASDAATAKSFGNQLCSGHGGSVPTGAGPTASGSSASGTGGTGTGGTESASATTASPVVSTVTSGSTTFETTITPAAAGGSVGSAGASTTMSAGSETITTVVTGTSGSSVFTTTETTVVAASGASGTSASASTEVTPIVASFSSGSVALSTTIGSGTAIVTASSTHSSGLGAHPTAAPAGLLAAAGLAALLL